MGRLRLAARAPQPVHRVPCRRRPSHRLAHVHLRHLVRLQERYNERFRWEQLITHSFDLDGANEALQAVRSGAAIKAVIRPNG